MLMQRGTFLSGLGAAVATVSRPAAAQPQTIRIGVGYADSMAEGVYAAKLDFFKKAGLLVEPTGFASGAQLSTAVAGGAIDIAVSNTVNIAVGIAHGAPFTLIAGGALYSSKAPTQALCVAGAAPIHTAKDLEGKTIAVTALKDLTEVGCRAWIDRAGSDSTKVRFVEITMGSMSAALERGTVDATFIGEPYLASAKRAGARVLGYAYDAIAPEFLLSTWFTTQDYYRRNSALVKHFVEVIYETARWANGHHDESAPILAEAGKMELSTITASTRIAFATSLEPRLIQPMLTLMTKYDALDRAIAASDLIAK